MIHLLPTVRLGHSSTGELQRKDKPSHQKEGGEVSTVITFQDSTLAIMCWGPFSSREFRTYALELGNCYTAKSNPIKKNIFMGLLE